MAVLLPVPTPGIIGGGRPPAHPLCSPEDPYQAEQSVYNGCQWCVCPHPPPLPANLSSLSPGLALFWRWMDR